MRGRGTLQLLRFAALAVCGSASAQELENTDVQHWALAPFLGTGAYEFDSEQTIYVLEFTPRWTWREGTPWDASPRRPTLEVLVPATLGLRSFDLANLPSTLDPDNVGTLSVVPGIYATLEMNSRWTLLGIANLGLGARLDGEEAALIHRLGLRSRFCLGDDETRWNLIAAIDHFGYKTDHDNSGQLMPLSLAVEVEIAVNAWAAKAGPTHLVVHLAGSHYLDELSFDAIGAASTAISNDLELGVAVKPAEPFRLWKLRWERIGIAYRRGEGQGQDEDGDRDSTFEGIRLYFRSLFEQ